MVARVLERKACSLSLMRFSFILDSLHLINMLIDTSQGNRVPRGSLRPVFSPILVTPEYYRTYHP